MREAIEIKNNSAETVGSINFDESGEHLGCRRNAIGFNITIPAHISLRLVPKDEPVPIVSRLHGYVFASDKSGAMGFVPIVAFVPKVGRLYQKSE